jgi:hypothetical protein
VRGEVENMDEEQEGGRVVVSLEWYVVEYWSALPIVEACG